MRSLITLILGLLLSLSFLYSKAQMVVASGTLTGQQLLTAPGVSFPSVAPTATGSSIQFARDTGQDLFVLPILASGIIAPGADYRVQFVANLTRQQSDNDPVFFVTDGNRMNGLGAGVSDDNGGSLSKKRIVSVSGGGVRSAITTLMFLNCSCFPATNTGSYESDVSITQTGGNKIDARMVFTGSASSDSLAGNTSYDPASALDPSTGLSLFMQNAGQGYIVNSISYSVTDLSVAVAPIPTTSEWGFLILGISFLLAGIVFIRRLA